MSTRGDDGEVTILCAACGHRWEEHPNPDRGLAGFEAMLRGEAEWQEADEIDYRSIISAECKVLDCTCTAFSPAPLPDGTYIPSGLMEDGIEILSYEPLGPRRVCALDRCAVAEDEPRYRVMLMPLTDGNDEAELRGDDLEWMDEWDAEDEDRDVSWRDDPTIWSEATPRFTPVIGCVKCILKAVAAQGDAEVVKGDLDAFEAGLVPPDDGIRPDSFVCGITEPHQVAEKVIKTPDGELVWVRFCEMCDAEGDDLR